MNILLVDDEKMILNGLKRILFGNKWKVYTAESGPEALELMSHQSIDLIISDMLMPGMDGAELLEKVSKLYPGVIRASLSGYSDPSITIKGGFFAHQAFMKPCEPSVIKHEIQRIAQLLDLFPDRVIQDAIGTITSLPIPPKLFFRVKNLLNQPNSSMHDVAQIVNEDPSMCAKIIHISNNAIFRGEKEVRSITEAITRLGSQIVTNIIAMLEIYSVSLNEPSKGIEDIQQHSLKVANLASKIVPKEMRDTTFLVGILHQIGEHVRMKVAPDLMKSYLSPHTKGQDKTHIEKYLFQTRSEHLGGYLLQIWGFPIELIENVALHNDPEKLIEKEFSPGCAVYIANHLIKGEELNPEFVEHFQLDEKLNEWKSL